MKIDKPIRFYWHPGHSHQVVTDHGDHIKVIDTSVARADWELCQNVLGYWEKDDEDSYSRSSRKEIMDNARRALGNAIER